MPIYPRDRRLARWSLIKQSRCLPPIQKAKIMRGFSAIGLFHPKTPENVGSTLRACQCYEVAMLAISGKRFKRACTDTFKTWRHMPVIETNDLKTIIPFGCVPVAIDLVDGAQKLTEYKHPERAFYIFGPEDGTLGAMTLPWCRDRVYIPTNGCMNLAATVNVVLYDRLLKG